MDPLDDDELARLARASSLALDAGEYADVPDAVVDRLRRLCLGLPEATENPGWAGVQWRIRKRRFAHVLAVDFPAGPVTTLVVTAPGPEGDALRQSGPPFFAPAWGAAQVGVVLDGASDWDDVAELVTESYRALAPRKLARLLDRPR